MSVGRLISVLGYDRMPLASLRRMTPRDAAAAALAAYLRAAVWLIPSDLTNKDRSFRLNSVLTEWPNEDDELNQPSASITTITEERQAHNFTPTVLLDTWEKFAPNTVLWKTDERQIVFQVDFWLTNKPERRAIESGLDEYFCPEEGRRGIMVEGPADYWSMPVRFQLQTFRGSERNDSSDLVLGRNRTLIARIVANIDDLQLRRAAELDPHISMAVDDGTPEVVIPRQAGD